MKTTKQISVTVSLFSFYILPHSVLEAAVEPDTLEVEHDHPVDYRDVAVLRPHGLRRVVVRHSLVRRSQGRKCLTQNM